jgi:sulfite reductase beta subunit-like hemoprotein
MDITDPDDPRIHIKMSGCPNGCSQHHIANIGFYGASIKVGEHTIPPTSRTSAATTKAARSSTAPA